MHTAPAKERNMRRTPLTIIAIGILFVGLVAAQSVPDFSGTWSLDPTRSEAEAGTPATMTILQSKEALTVDREIEGKPDRIVYKIQRGEVATPIPAVGSRGPDELGPTAEQQATAEWRDGRLETQRVLSINGKTVTQVERRSLDDTGREMTVETLVQVQHGYETGQAHNGAKNVYVKKAR